MEQANPDWSLVQDTRRYSFGMGAERIPSSRMWIETISDPDIVHLYRLEESTSEMTVFSCLNCTNFGKTTRVVIEHLENDTVALWEESFHLPSCLREKEKVEKVMQLLEKPPVFDESFRELKFPVSRSASVPASITPSSIVILSTMTPRKGTTAAPASTRTLRKRTAASTTKKTAADKRSRTAADKRSRTAADKRSRTPATAAKQEPTRSISTAPSRSKPIAIPKYRGRKPNLDAFMEISETHWKLEDAEEFNLNSKLFIFADPEKKIGKEFSYHCQFQDGHLFCCDNCFNLTTQQQRRKAFVRIVDGKPVITEGKHYSTCRPYEL